MSYVWQRWLAAELRADAERLGLDVDVIEVDGWENRGRPASTGHFDPQGAHTKHHTGATSSATNPIPTLQTLIVGRVDLPGPLSQVACAFNGDIYVIAAGRANHAGRVGKSGVVGMPLGADGNALAIGDEVDTNGTQTLPEAQMRSMALVSRVVTRHCGRSVEWIHRHQDISSTGKWDIGNRTTQQLRDDVAGLPQEDDMAQYDEEINEILTTVKRIDRRSQATREGVAKLNGKVKRGLDQGRDAREVLKEISTELEALAAVLLADAPDHG